MRREWIEMSTTVPALSMICKSPSMRREWIEISDLSAKPKSDSVSLHAEGVD